MLAVEQMLTGKFERYKSAINAWLSKGALADEIIADCPVSELVSLPDIADGIRSPQQRREKKQRSAKQAYMNGIRKPCGNAPETLDDEYKKLTKAVADSFEEIDKFLIWAALVATDKNELDFFLLLLPKLIAFTSPCALTVQWRPSIQLVSSLIFR